MRVISLGAGVQSTTLVLLALKGEIPPVDCAVFADTQWEPKAVYEHLRWLRRYAWEQHGFPIYRVTMGDIRRDAVGREKARTGSLPLFVKNASGKQGKLLRQCTREYKIDPVKRKVRKLMKAQRFGGDGKDFQPYEMLIGISLDEFHRMKPSRVKYITNRHPLVDLRITRNDCYDWLTENGYNIPPKSSCIGCPFHDDAYWRDMKLNTPEEFADAVEFDTAIRSSKGVEGQAFLHRSLKPLGEVDLRNAEDVGQMLLFQGECEGYCGV